LENNRQRNARIGKSDLEDICNGLAISIQKLEEIIKDHKERVEKLSKNIEKT